MVVGAPLTCATQVVVAATVMNTFCPSAGVAPRGTTVVVPALTMSFWVELATETTYPDGFVQV